MASIHLVATIKREVPDEIPLPVIASNDTVLDGNGAPETACLSGIAVAVKQEDELQEAENSTTPANSSTSIENQRVKRTPDGVYPILRGVTIRQASQITQAMFNTGPRIHAYAKRQNVLPPNVKASKSKKARMSTSFDPEAVCMDFIQRFSKNGVVLCLMCGVKVSVTQGHQDVVTVSHATEHAFSHLQTSRGIPWCSCQDIHGRIFRHQKTCPNYDPLANGYVDRGNESLNGLLSYLTKCYDRSKAPNIPWPEDEEPEADETESTGSGNENAVVEGELEQERNVKEEAIEPETPAQPVKKDQNGRIVISEEEPPPPRMLAGPAKMKYLAKLRLKKVINQKFMCTRCWFTSKNKGLVQAHLRLCRRANKA